MKPQFTILSELKEIAPVLGTIGSEMPYHIPKGYFQNLEAAIFDKIVLNNLKEKPANFGQVPEAYFESLASGILQKLADQGFRDTLVQDGDEFIHTPILDSINKEMPYSVPADYFKNIIVESSFNKKVTIAPIRSMRKWVTYAAAAVFVGLMVTGSFLFSDKPSENEFEKYQQMDVAAALDQVTDTELNHYIADNHAQTFEEIAASDADNLNNLDEKLQTISSENLDAYLKETGMSEAKSNK